VLPPHFFLCSLISEVRQQQGACEAMQGTAVMCAGADISDCGNTALQPLAPLDLPPCYVGNLSVVASIGAMVDLVGCKLRECR
jgi:hypothetical protein